MCMKFSIGDRGVDELSSSDGVGGGLGSSCHASNSASFSASCLAGVSTLSSVRAAVVWSGVLVVVGSCLLVLVGGLSFVLFYGYKRQLVAGVCSVLHIHKAEMIV